MLASRQDRVIHLDDATYKGAPRRARDITLCILHSTEGSDAHTGMDWVNRVGASPRSAHYFVDRDGTIYRSVKVDFVAYHAGVSEWPVVDDPIPAHHSVNARSIGIEIAGDTGSVRALTREQLLSVVWLCQWVRESFNIEPLLFRGHREVAPVRKIDPTPAFLDLEWFRQTFADATDESALWDSYAARHSVAAL